MSQASLQSAGQVEHLLAGLATPHTHPDRLASIAKLFGMQPQPIDGARVLELGCGAGGNLLPMAERHPESHYLGIDSSRRAIEAGRQTIERVGLSNVELRLLEKLSLADSDGPFDYIICQGLFSGLPCDVQDTVLGLCKSQLAPQGVAYIDYKAYPGWHLHDVIREIARGAVPSSTPLQARIAAAVRSLHFVSQSFVGDKSPYGWLMKQEIDKLLARPAESMVRDYLADENHPYYFHEFAERISKHGLQYLGDTTISTMFAENLGKDVHDRLVQLSGDAIDIEQLLDVIGNRTLRQTLICRGDVSLVRQVSPATLEGLNFAALVRPHNAAVDLAEGVVEKFQVESPGAAGSAISTPAPLVKAALAHLGSIWPRSADWSGLVAAAQARLASGGQQGEISAAQRHDLGHNLIQLLASGLVTVHSRCDDFMNSVSDKPTAGAVARFQARTGGQVTNRRHETLELEPMTRQLMGYLDSQHDLADLLEILIAAAQRGEVSVMADGAPATNLEDLRPMLQDAIEQRLNLLASHAFLVA